jgi:hypothetical protein
MTPEDVRAAAERLTQLHQRFAPLFGKDGAQNHAYVYVKGLMTCPERKSVEPIALLGGEGRVSALQKFVNSAPWGHEYIQAVSRLGALSKEEVALSRELGTPPLPEAHLPVGYCWQNSSNDEAQLPGLNATSNRNGGPRRLQRLGSAPFLAGPALRYHSLSEPSSGSSR